MTAFNIGDRIKVKRTGVMDCPELKNKEGIIMYVQRHSVTVAFPNWDRGHNGNGASFYDSSVRHYNTGNNVWHCGADEVELIIEFDVTMHPDNLKYLKIVNKIKYLEDKFNNRSNESYA